MFNGKDIRCSDVLKHWYIIWEVSEGVHLKGSMKLYIIILLVGAGFQEVAQLQTVDRFHI